MGFQLKEKDKSIVSALESDAEILRSASNVQMKQGLANLPYGEQVERLQPTQHLEHYLGNPMGGQALDGDVQAKMEQGFGRPVEGRRIHADQNADVACKALGARAFAHGTDMYFGAGEYNPSSAAGQELLAHEVTHTFQQTGGGLQTRLTVGGAKDGAEREADQVAHQVVSRINGSPGVPGYVQRAMVGSPAQRLQMKRDLSSFAQANSAEGLAGASVQLSEQPVRINEHNPVSTLRCMGRADSPREQDMERANIGDEDFVQAIFRFFYPGMRQPNASDRCVQQLAADMMAAAIRGSRAMDYVPRPPSNPSPTWLFTEVVKTAWRRGQDEGIYVAVRNEVARGHRTRYSLAVEGACM